MIDTAAMTDDRMMPLLGSARTYTTCVLRPGPEWGAGNWQQVLWEHGRRNMVMREGGILVVTLRVPGPDIVGIGVFDRDLEATRKLLDGDPAVQADILTFTLYTTDGFPGDALP